MSDQDQKTENPSEKPAKNQKKLKTVDAKSELAAEMANSDADRFAAGNQQRLYRGTKEIDHDLFKLLPAEMLKNVSINPETPDLQKATHVHFFHTVDSNGKKQLRSASVGGHFHDVEVIEDPNGGVPKLKISPAKIAVRKKVRGVATIVSEPVRVYKDPHSEDAIVDDHTHDYEYVNSCRVAMRQANVEFAKFESQIKAHQNPVVENVVEK